MRSLDWCPHKKKEVEHRATHRKSHVKIKTEIKMMHPQAKGCLQATRVRRGTWNSYSLRASHLNLHLRMLNSRMKRK